MIEIYLINSRMLFKRKLVPDGIGLIMGSFLSMVFLFAGNKKAAYSAITYIRNFPAGAAFLSVVWRHMEKDVGLLYSFFLTK